MRVGRPVCGQEQPLPRCLRKEVKEMDHLLVGSREGDAFPKVGTHCPTPRKKDGPAPSHCVKDLFNTNLDTWL